jgi:hypothetical protein
MSWERGPSGSNAEAQRTQSNAEFVDRLGRLCESLRLCVYRGEFEAEDTRWVMHRKLVRREITEAFYTRRHRRMRNLGMALLFCGILYSALLLLKLMGIAT